MTHACLVSESRVIGVDCFHYFYWSNISSLLKIITIFFLHIAVMMAHNFIVFCDQMFFRTGINWDYKHIKCQEIVKKHFIYIMENLRTKPKAKMINPNQTNHERIFIRMQISQWPVPLELWYINIISAICQ